MKYKVTIEINNNFKRFLTLYNPTGRNKNNVKQFLSCDQCRKYSKYGGNLICKNSWKSFAGVLSLTDDSETPRQEVHSIVAKYVIELSSAKHKNQAKRDLQTKNVIKVNFYSVRNFTCRYSSN